MQIIQDSKSFCFMKKDTPSMNFYEMGGVIENIAKSIILIGRTDPKPVT